MNQKDDVRKKTDFLVIGSGIAGLSYALKAAQHGTVTVITKGDEDESNTKYAQGGIAAVTYKPDSIRKHIEDTLDCGGGLCDENIVRIVVTEGSARINEMIEWGAQFDKTPSGEYDLAMEGGHTEKRILHHKDATGLEIERTLLKQVHDNKNITLYSHHFAVDLITQHHLGEDVRRGEKGITCYGAYVLDLKSGIVETVLSRITLVAAGGAGHIYSSTTNPVIATGDGVAMVYRAKGEVDHMEFIQFHPTALYNPGEHPSFLISEAMRGSGAILRLADGTDFMLRYDPRGSLAPRDIVARGIDSEMKKSGEDHVFLDCTMIPREELERHFPNIMEKCQKIGYNISNEWIPVLPAAHFFCGGIKVDENGKSTLDRLYAIGECSSTGLHGANRLASNSLLEAAVFSHRAYLHGSKMFMDYDWNDAVPDWNAEGTSDARELVLVSHNLKTLQAVMSDYVGIVRSDARLKKALDRLRIIYGETEAFYENTVISKRLCELRNLINVAYLVVKASMERKENIGLFFNADLTGSDNKTNEIHP